ncbi:hypothetical protein JRQ81_002237 [Phrynocephalus forsythii]|uniref:Uncharacterized protein n=1 Tax=Phrynocephalus forsythii TaxID=171643 RepID=A0A9Q0XJI9_9SAUR|nr:hypothetical protein JRQ81_002237 [Phrynocephalus forsythii]
MVSPVIKSSFHRWILHVKLVCVPFDIGNSGKRVLLLKDTVQILVAFNLMNRYFCYLLKLYLCLYCSFISSQGNCKSEAYLLVKKSILGHKRRNKKNTAEDGS